MGIFSEVHAESQATNYEDILIAAIEMHKDKDEPFFGSFPILDFCKEHILPKYNNAVRDAWRIHPTKNQKIIEDFFGG